MQCKNQLNQMMLIPIIEMKNKIKSSKLKISFWKIWNYFIDKFLSIYKGKEGVG